MTAFLLILSCLAAFLLTGFLCLRAYGWEIRVSSLLQDLENENTPKYCQKSQD